MVDLSVVSKACNAHDTHHRSRAQRHDDSENHEGRATDLISFETLLEGSYAGSFRPERRRLRWGNEVCEERTVA